MSEKQNGFTLLELLIALVIVSLVMAAAFGGVRVGSRSWEAGHKRADAVEEMQAFAEFLRRQVGQTVPVLWENEAGNRLAYEGGQYQVRFVAPAPFDSGRVGLLTYTLMIDRGTENSRLRISYDPYDPGADEFRLSPGDAGITLATTFKSPSLDYYGAINSDGPDSWHREWPATAESYPKLLRIEFGTDDGDATWPALVLPLRSRQAP